MSGGMYLAMIERRLRRTVKDIGAENDLLNDLGFNLCVVPRCHMTENTQLII